jgi:hypothetical protein
MSLHSQRLPPFAHSAFPSGCSAFARGAGALPDGGLQLLEIVREHRFAREHVSEVIQKEIPALIGRVSKLVKHPVPIATVQDQSHALEVVQMPGHVRLREFQHVLDIATAQLSLKEEVQHPEARGF